MLMESLEKLEGTVEKLLREMENLREENQKLKQELKRMNGAGPLQNEEALNRLKSVIKKLESLSITKS